MQSCISSSVGIAGIAPFFDVTSEPVALAKSRAWLISSSESEPMGLSDFKRQYKKAL